MTELFRLGDLHFSYGPDRPVLAGAGLTLAAGERLALLGANGAGKTTLLHLMVGLVAPACGTIWAFGRERRSESDFHEIRARAGLLFQDPEDQLFCATVREDVAFGPLNLGLGHGEALDVTRRVLAELGLSGYENRITHHLSGGEKRMVSLACVLAMQPDILLLDEPTNALDDDSRERLLAILENLSQAMVIVSHDHDCIDRLATRRLRLVNGCLLPA